ncbi:MAG: hypothetical protein WBX19_21840 [Terracidiphilus sp.]
MIRATLLSTLCLVLSPLLVAQQAVPTPAPSHPAVTISKGTKIELIAMESVSSETAIKGSTVRFAVANDISVNGLIVVWAGTPITDKVTKVRRGTAYRQWAVLKIRVNAVTLTNGSTLRLTRSRPRNRRSIAPKDIATCAALFPLCILAAFGATEDGNEKPGAHSNEQSVLSACSVWAFWTPKPITIPAQSMGGRSSASASSVACAQRQTIAAGGFVEID